MRFCRNGDAPVLHGNLIDCMVLYRYNKKKVSVDPVGMSITYQYRKLYDMLLTTVRRWQISMCLYSGNFKFQVWC